MAEFFCEVCQTTHKDLPDTIPADLGRELYEALKDDEEALALEYGKRPDDDPTVGEKAVARYEREVESVQQPHNPLEDE